MRTDLWFACLLAERKKAEWDWITDGPALEQSIRTECERLGVVESEYAVA